MGRRKPPGAEDAASAILATGCNFLCGFVCLVLPLLFIRGGVRMTVRMAVVKATGRIPSDGLGRIGWL